MLRASAIYAGIEIARLRPRFSGDAVAALKYIRQGDADTSALDFSSAVSIAEQHTWDVFSAEPLDVTAFRSTIGNIARAESPFWIELTPLGRAKVIAAMESDAVQCLQIAGLLGIDEECLSWWDEIAARFRNRQQERRMKAGRAAERRSFELEQLRLAGTGLKVLWVGIEDNTVGFDVKTWRPATSPEDTTALDSAGNAWREHAIEVKSAMKGDPVRITRNEFEQALLRGAKWELHVWLPAQPLPRVVAGSKVLPNVPLDRAAGKWSEVRIPVGALVGE